MSHVVSHDTVVKEEHLDCFAQACTDCGLEFKPNQKNYKFFGSWVNDYHKDDAAYKNGFDPKEFGKCEHAASVKDKPDAYEIGLVKRPNGQPGYNLLCDFYAKGRGLMEHVSQDGPSGKVPDKLLQQYAARVAEKKLKQAGFGMQRKVNSKGHIVIEAIRIRQN